MATEQRHEAARLIGASSLPVILLVAAMVVGVAALLPLVQSSGATTTGGNILGLEQQREELQARLHEKEIKVAQLGSLDRIEQEATKRLKMVPPASIRYIRVDAPAPEPHRLPSRFLPQEAEDAQAGSSLWDGLFGWLPLP